MEAAAVEVALEEGGGQAEGFLAGSVLEDLLGFEGTVGIMASDPVAKSLGEGVVIERMLQIPHGTIHNGDRVNQPLIMHELGPEETDVPSRGLYIAQLASLEEIAAADAIGDKSWIGVASDGLEFGGSFRGEALVGVDHKEPGVFIRDIMDAPATMEAFVAAIGGG